MEQLISAIKLLASQRTQNLSRLDSGYDRAMNTVVTLRDQYEDLPLKEEHRRTIDSLIDALDDAEAEQVSMAYLAGMMDCILVMNTLQVFKL